MGSNPPSERLFPAGTILGDRWRLGERIGAGATGEVVAAEDLLGGSRAAVKIVLPTSERDRIRLRREVAALRLLRLPGVVQVIDDGQVGDRHYIVMELVEGSRFAGAFGDGSWERLRPPVLALLGVLSRVHAAGVVHRDLKPANVLVDASGTVTLVDFGLARGLALGETITSTNALVGTPAYLAPEQLTGRPLDARSDLYSVGVMLFEQLTGHGPHPVSGLAELYYARCETDAPSIHGIRPDLPLPVARLIDALLRRQPEDRPGSATEALAMLGASPGRWSIPHLGSSDITDRVVAAVLAGRGIAVDGPRGSGRSRVLRDAAARIETEGITVHWATAGSRPFESLRRVVGEIASQPDTPQAVAAEVQRLLGERNAIFVDEPKRLDRWSARILELARELGPVVGAWPGGELISPLAEAELRPLFLGPDRLFHLCEDGAKELYRRAGGLPARIEAEVEAWVAAGLATIVDDKVACERDALERLASGVRVEPTLIDAGDAASLEPALRELLAWVALSWPRATLPEAIRLTGRPQWELDEELADLETNRHIRRLPDGRWEAVAGTTAALSHWQADELEKAHRELAAGRSPGDEGRLEHLVGGGMVREAAREAREMGRVLAERGHLESALAVLEIGLGLAREEGGGQVEQDVLVAGTVAALRVESPRALGAWSRIIARTAAHSPVTQACAAPIEAAAAAETGDRDGAVAAARALDLAPVAALDVARTRLLVDLLLPGRLPDAAAELERIRSWSNEGGERAGLWSLWAGRVAYSCEDYASAAQLYGRAAGLLPPGDGLAGLLGRATALLDGSQFVDAIPAAREARERARGARQAIGCAQAEWVLRSAEYRKGVILEVDHELLDIVERRLSRRTLGPISIVEAGVAWRRGELALARELATRSAAIFAASGFAPAAAMMNALGLACGRRDSVLAGAAFAIAARRGVPGLDLQTLALICHADASWAPQCAPIVEELVESVSPGARETRLEVLAPAEALSHCRVALGGAP
jgi:tetratricopeptide (TPR) repeat protein